MDELIYFCNRQDIPERVINQLAYYDFSETREMAFVHTIGGSHTKDWNRTGFCGLGRAIKKLGYQSGKGLEVDYVVSSHRRLIKALLTIPRPRRSAPPEKILY